MNSQMQMIDESHLIFAPGEIDMPATLRVGPFDFRIESWSSREASAADRYGECDRFNNVIRVRDDLNGQRTAETMIHEILNAVWGTQAFEGDQNEESIVTGISLGLAQVMRDNPEMIAWLQQKLEQP